jgi:hypothetical protein
LTQKPFCEKLRAMKQKPPPKKNPAAVALGKLAAGKKKKLTSAEIAKRTERLAEARKKRWEKKP